MKDQGHNLASKLRMFTGIYERHQVNGLLILVATTPATNARSRTKLPPTRNCMIEKSKKIMAP